MTTARTTSTKNCYEILGIEDLQHASTVSADQLRIAYKRTLLLHHPDKKQSNATLTVDQISLAYKILSDPVLKREYDVALRGGHEEAVPTKFKIFHTGLDTYDLDDLTFDVSRNHWTKSCRCGDAGGFVITEAELEANAPDGELITGCKGCSLWIKVLFGIDE